jgi:uncharacterized membrane protein
MSSDRDLEEQLAALTARVYSLERSVEAMRPSPASAGEPAPAPPAVAQPLPMADPSPRVAAGARSLENRIGSQFLNRVGIFAMLIGAAWFLKLAFDRNWIGPTVRILIGLSSAAAIVAWSERFRRHGFAAFSYTLKALGTGIGYLSLWAAASVYRLLPFAPSFLAMSVLTAANALLAWRQDSELLAAYALAGGLATPALLSMGKQQETFLFSYLLMLDAGALLLLIARPWKRLAAGAFVGTVLYYALWSIAYYEPPAFTTTMIFAAAFFAAFASAPFLLLHKIGGAARSSTESLFLVIFPMANAAVVFAEMMFLLDGPRDHDLRAATAFSLAAVFLLLAIAAPRLFTGTLSNVHLGLAIFFLTVAIPIAFEGCTVTLCWLGEALGLIAVSAVRGYRAMRVFAAAVLTLVALDVVFLEWIVPAHQPLAVIENTHFATYLIACGVFAGAARLSLGRQEGEQEYGAMIFRRESSRPLTLRDLSIWGYLSAFSMIFFSLTALLAVSLEIHHYWFCGASFFQNACGYGVSHGGFAVYASFSLSAWFMLYGAALMTAGFLLQSAFLRWQALLLMAFSIGKVFLADAGFLTQGYRVLSFLALGVLLLAVSFAYQKDWLALRESSTGSRARPH